MSLTAGQFNHNESNKPRRIVIMGAAGRDFHNFNVFYRNNPDFHVVAFTATQIPDIEGRVYPASLAGAGYPTGIPIIAEEELQRLIEEQSVDEVVFAYSDVSHEYVMHRASMAMAAGADFRLMGPGSTMLQAKVPVVAVTAVRTGAGKSQTTRRVAEILTESGLNVVVVRHPMPYGNLEEQAVQRFAHISDLEKHKCTIEELEEYEPHIDRGNVVYAGVDYEKILEQAQEEADVLLWDGGNNDFSFFKPDLTITIVDPHRPGDETTYHPGETNLRCADLVIINKVDSASQENVDKVMESVKTTNPEAQILTAASPITVDDPHLVRGKRAVIVEDGPTLTHGGMAFGAGSIAAEDLDVTPVDPRPFATGSLTEVFQTYDHLDHLVPAMGYGEDQMKELEETVNSTPADVVIIGTPIDLSRLLKLNKPAVRVHYELQELDGPSLSDVLNEKIIAKTDLR